ncbi:transcriptional regulator [Gluconacetobacter johannae DSM 13595]|uniref:TetR family transcriptional regulator n=1 Tax=Gluconacetobacter johannae TaxID=112140 RepID=A0A7W4J5J2_9PROT|nr:TetR/AcrR family transcriptional regulator [Gluconacetobacter johannae]MBB2175072.1 TetR family transcriptional regulator [Gluconacetobacter johannae]GBQ87092.1 transcriptional regulator [Gluconacetobacter johannae DSM 13595]
MSDDPACLVTPPLSRRRGRPPRAPGDGDDVRDLLIRTGIALLTEKGYVATGLDEILQIARVPKGSFYHYFDSKESFGLRLIDGYAAYFDRRLERFLSDDARAPLDRLRAMIDDACAGMARHAYRRGCLVGNLGQEMGALPESFRQRLHDVLLGWQARTAHCLRLARDAGDIAPGSSCADLAAFFWIGWEGAVLRAKLERGPVPLRLFEKVFIAGLGASAVGARARSVSGE